MMTNSVSLSTFASTKNLSAQRQSTEQQTSSSFSAYLVSDETKITISQAAQDALDSAKNTSVESRLAKIKLIDAQSRTSEDWNFLFANDEKLAEITAKANRIDDRYEGLTAAEFEYSLVARGAINTFKYLSNDEKDLYDELVAKGNMAAANGVGQIAFMRATGGHTAGGQNGSTYDPINTEITAVNILNLFSRSIIDPSGETQKQFQALAQYLQSRPVN